VRQEQRSADATGGTQQAGGQRKDGDHPVVSQAGDDVMQGGEERNARAQQDWNERERPWRIV
jgi:hypothetical protein